MGRSLIQKLCQVAAEHECSRVEWTADEGNALAESFYQQLGVPKNQDKVIYRLEGEKLRGMGAAGWNEKDFRR